MREVNRAQSSSRPQRANPLKLPHERRAEPQVTEKAARSQCSENPCIFGRMASKSERRTLEAEIDRLQLLGHLRQRLRVAQVDT